MNKTALKVPPSWRRSPDRLSGQGSERVVVVGASDRGKSSFCGFLVRTLAAHGDSVAFVDADPGQKDVGPPGTIAMAYGRADRALGQLEVAGLYFIGSASPMGHFPHLVIGARRLVDAAGARVTVVDTTGLVHGPGRLLKTLQFESLQPTLVVAIERKRELDGLLLPFRHLNILRLPSSPVARPRSVKERRLAREAAFRSYFRDAVERTLPLKQLAFQRTIVFSGKPERSAGALWAERHPEGLLTVGGPSAGRHRRLRPGFEHGVLCGLGDGNQRCLGLGVLQSIDFDRGLLHLLTPVDPRCIRVVQPGALRVRPDGRHTAVPREEWFPG